MPGPGFVFDARAWPAQPGVYRMRSAAGESLYVGKAADLRRRLSQYFQEGSRDNRFQVDLLLAEVAGVEVIVTPGERDALVLENQLIKAEQPRYNLRLKDGKTYPWIGLSREDFPRLEITRERDDARYEYFGPFPVAAEAHRLLELVVERCRLRRCPGVPLERLARPCLYAQTGTCSAPCVGRITATDYARDVARARLVLAGDTAGAAAEARREMEVASAAEEFEKAARWRDIWQSLLGHAGRRLEDRPDGPRLDVVAGLHGRGWILVSVLRVAGRTLAGREFVQLRAMDDWPHAVATVLLEFYAHFDIPRTVAVDTDFPGRGDLETVLSERAGRRVQVSASGRGALAGWLAMARQNAAAELSCREAAGRLGTSAEHLQAVALELALPVPPALAIALDVSVFGGEEPCGGVATFRDGRPERRSYRHYRLRGTAGAAGDPQWMEELLARHLQRLAPERPDLVLVDGGEAQLAVAARVCGRLGLPVDRRLVAMAKGPERKSGEERLLVHGDPAPRTLRECPVAMRLLVEMRDEAHRFAGRLNRRRVSGARLASGFRAVPGIGPKADRVLRETFGTLEVLLRSGTAAVDGLAGLSRRQKDTLRRMIGGEGTA